MRQRHALSQAGCRDRRNQQKRCAAISTLIVVITSVLLAATQLLGRAGKA